jgi:transcriptional regulator with XRE-family HTH domain
MTSQESFGQRLQRLLAESGRSQAWLADTARLSSSVVSRLVRGERLPTFEHVAAMAPPLGLTVDALVAGTEAAQKIAVVCHGLDLSERKAGGAACQAAVDATPREHRSRSLIAIERRVFCATLTFVKRVIFAYLFVFVQTASFAASAVACGGINIQGSSGSIFLLVKTYHRDGGAVSRRRLRKR